MSSKVPLAKQETDLLAFIPRILFIAILCFCFYPLEKKFFLLIAVFAYLMLVQLSRFFFLPNVLYKSTGLIRKANFEMAIPVIKECIEYFRKRDWVDKYRFPLLISTSKNSITETLICNLAYCYLQIGEVKKSKELYQEVVDEFPENISAKTMLNTIKLISLNAADDKIN